MIAIKEIVENRDRVEEALLKRVSKDELDLDACIEAYSSYKQARIRFDEARAQQKRANDDMAKLDKNSEEFTHAVAEMKLHAQIVRDLEKESTEKKRQFQTLLDMIPNIPDDDVAPGGKEANEVIREEGDEPRFSFEPKHHVDLSTSLGIIDFDRAVKLGGSHMMMYVGDGARLEWSLINYFINRHIQDGYQQIIPPHLLNKTSAYVAGQIPKFTDDVYWVHDGYCLLPTAETALVNIHRDEILEEKDLPRKYFSYTPCYRREAGSHGARDRGLMRVHQFNKVEMFQYTKPEDSEKALDELVGRAEQLVKDLGLRYRVTKLAAGDISFAMAKTFDVEVWLPYDKSWTEVSSISNGRDFQALRGNMRYRTQDGETRHMHTLNASGLATPRLMVALLESYQQEDGSVVVPDVLRSDMGKDTLTP